MTLGKLRTIIASHKELHDDTPVVVSDGPDHSYQHVSIVHAETVGQVKRDRNGRNLYFEWHGEYNAQPGEEPVKALVVEIR